MSYKLIPVAFKRSYHTAVGKITLLILDENDKKVAQLIYSYRPNKNTYCLESIHGVGSQYLRWPVLWDKTEESVMNDIIAFDNDHGIDVRRA